MASSSEEGEQFSTIEELMQTFLDTMMPIFLRMGTREAH